MFKFSQLLIMTLLLTVVATVKAEQLSSASQLKNAIALRQTGQHHDAVKILEQLRTLYLDHKRVNIELVINYINLKQYPEAQSSIDHLKGLPLSGQESQKLLSLQQLIEKSNQQVINRHFYSAELQAHVGVDSFTSPFPVYEYLDYDELGEYVELDDIDIEYSLDDRSEEAKKQQDAYTSQHVRGLYRYRPDNRFNFFGQPSSLIWFNNLSLYQKQVNDESDSRYRQLKIDSTSYLLQANSWMFDLRLRGSYHSNDGNKMLSDHSLQLSATMPLEQARIKVGLELKKKSFDNFNSNIDASVASPWLEYAVNLSDQFRLSAGSRYRKNHARDQFYTYDNLNFYTSLHYNDSEALTAFITLNHNNLHYEVDDPELVAWAKERKRSVAIGVKYRFNNHFSTGLNSHFVTNKRENDNGNDEWDRVEAYIGYKF